jgi:uncharacterized protein YbjT (DUF2867 family)
MGDLTMETVAIVVGATGLVGREIVQCLLEDSHYNRVIIWVRQATGIKHNKLIERVVDFDDLDSETAYFDGAVVFCALGTTIKAAKTKEAFRKVDYTYPLRLAELVQKHKAKQFHIVTAIGTNPNSSVFYSQVKGQLEAALKQLNLPSLHIYHPSLLLGKRKEFRLGERIGAAFMKVLSIGMIGSLSKYKAIHVKTLAKGMVLASLKGLMGTKIYEYKDINE